MENAIFQIENCLSIKENSIWKIENSILHKMFIIIEIVIFLLMLS